MPPAALSSSRLSSGSLSQTVSLYPVLTLLTVKQAPSRAFPLMSVLLICNPPGAGVGVLVGVKVGVLVAVFVGVAVLVGVAVFVGVFVGVLVTVAVAVFVGVLVRVG